MYACEGVRNVIFSENFGYILREWPHIGELENIVADTTND